MKWNKLFDCCEICETTKYRHMARGRCKYCYLKLYHNDPKNIDRVKKQKYDHHVKTQLPRQKEIRENKHFSGNRIAALDRDFNTCQICFNPGNIVHHIDGNGRGSTNPNNSLDNLKTLCRRCHLAEHRNFVLERRFKTNRDGWSKKFATCINCHKTDSPHNSKGRCQRCIAKLRRM